MYLTKKYALVFAISALVAPPISASPRKLFLNSNCQKVISKFSKNNCKVELEITALDLETAQPMPDKGYSQSFIEGNQGKVKWKLIFDPDQKTLDYTCALENNVHQLQLEQKEQECNLVKLGFLNTNLDRPKLISDYDREICDHVLKIKIDKPKHAVCYNYA